MFKKSKPKSALAVVEERVRAILPQEYQDSYEDVRPVSMGSAGLKYGADGKVEWDRIWDTFCDLAMAGGPPHKGTLLKPGSSAEITAQPDRYNEVVEEIRRGVSLVADLDSERAGDSGWVRVQCNDEVMSGWLLRAVTMENIAARAEGVGLFLPAGPGYRVEKEIKNVITVIAKTCHYWLDHMWASEERAISDLFTKMSRELPLIEPAYTDGDVPAEAHRNARAKLSEAILRQTGLASSNHTYAAWLGMECGDVRTAVWIMRALVAGNILSRREETVLFVPVNPVTDPEGARVAASVKELHGFAVEKVSANLPRSQPE